MNDYLSTLTLEAPLDRDGLRRLAIHACLDLHQVRWLRSFVAMDGKRMLCWYQARDAESVRLVLRQQGSAGAGVWPVAVTDVAGSESLDSSVGCMVVELPLSSPDADEVASLTAGISAALRGSGAVLRRTFLSSRDARLMGVVEAGNPGTVVERLDAAGILTASLWECAAFDPRPPKLFESHAASKVRELDRDAESFGAAAPVAASEWFDAIVIGAGLSGMCALERFTRMGLSVRVFESGSDVGGVWYWNRYPGARVDSEVHTYGFSFSDELIRDWNWQELFAAQPEISGYLRHVADRFDLRRHIQFDTRVASAAYDDHHACWMIETDTGERARARYLIMAAGTLSAPQLPDYPGMRDFTGESCHTADWPESGIDLRGKRVGVVGTGASGVQVIQTIAAEVDHLTVFQRTPTYCIPQRNRPLTEADLRRIREDWGQILKTCRESYGGFIHTFDPRSGLRVSAEEREAKFEELWRKSGFAFWFGNFADLMMNSEVNSHACEFLRNKIRARVHDPDTARKLLPDHPFGTKRVPLECGYYETYNRSNVTLVDLRETPIERVTPSGILTSRQAHPLDVIVYATGFDAGTGSITRIDVRGADGVSLEDKWRDGPTTFLGLLVSGFPNLFIVNGPHNAAALCNAGRCIDQNVDWIARCIERMCGQGIRRVVPAPAAEAEWTQHVYDVAEASVLAAMKNSWFFGANTPGKPQRVNIYAAGASEYRKQCEAVANSGFTGLEFS